MVILKPMNRFVQVPWSAFSASLHGYPFLFHFVLLHDDNFQFSFVLKTVFEICAAELNILT